MLLSGVDFSGLFGLGDDISASQAADIVWDNMPAAVNRFTLPTFANMSVEQFKSRVADALSGQYHLVQASSAPNNAVSDSVITSISPDNASYISSALQSMRSNGYYVVGAVAAPVVQNTPSAQSVSSGPPSRGQLLQQQAQPTATNTATAPTTQFQNSPRQLNVPIRVRRQAAQTAAQKQRLLWIVGGFGLFFVIALGLIASNSGD